MAELAHQNPLSVEASLQLLRSRNWAQLSSWWLPYISVSQPPGSRPELGVGELASIGQATSELLAAEASLLRASDLAEVRTSTLSEAIFLLHKAANVLAAAEQEAVSGFFSWSISSSYQASYFAARSILSFLGITTIRGAAGGKDLLLDAWAEDTRLPQKRRQSGDSEDRLVQLLVLSEQVTHRGVWQIFQRSIRVLRIDIWPPNCLAALRHLEEGAFARERNRLHYESLVWPFEDLHWPACPYPSLVKVPKECGSLRQQGGDLALSVALVLVDLGYRLLLSLADHSARLTPESLLLRQVLWSGRNPLLARHIELTNSPGPITTE